MSNLRIAIYYESRLGRNDGNPLYIWNVLKRMEKQKLLEVDQLAPNGQYELHGHYDAHIWSDWGEDGLTHILPYSIVWPVQNGKDPVVYWPTDTHINGASYGYRLANAKHSDIVFTAQKITVEQFAKDGVKATWLPCAFEPQAYPKYELLAPHYDICFVGHINSEHRIDMLDRMFREFPNFFFGQRIFEDAARIYNDSKVCLNISLNKDINMRVFEVTGCGGFLLTDRIESLNELYEDGKHLVMYDGLDDAVEKARYYIEHEDERKRIAQAGYEHALANHTMEKRVEIILNEIRKFKEEPCLV